MIFLKRAPTVIFLLFIINLSFAQQSTDFFDFWAQGTWQSELTIYNGDTIVEKDIFVVEKLENMNAFLEDWTIFIGEGEFVSAKVMRAFDNETKRWKLFYVDDLNAQTWDSEEIDGQLYFSKTFTYKGKQFYSRQYWSPMENGKVLRIIERSDDNEHWKPRYRQIFSFQ
ncbi:MAG: hypothetical protein DWQ02_05850 [Bacteroidetes bacterium]|nr:MAG: hypothetical protein DWQ02_05850 [Bacteroidota bacterium]